MQRVHLAPGSQSRGLPRCLSGKKSACQCRRSRRHGFDQEDPLEKQIATHSSVLAWTRIPWTEEPGRLQSKELQKSQTDWVTQQQQTMSSVISSTALLPAMGFISMHNMLTVQCSYLTMHNWPLFFIPFHFTLPSIVSVQDLLRFLFSVNIFPFLHICPQGIF